MSMRVGLEGRILVALMVVITLALGATCWFWAHQSRARLTDVMGEETREIARILALAAAPAIKDADRNALQRIGDDLLPARNIAFVVFEDSGGTRLSISRRGRESRGFTFLDNKANVASLMLVQRETLPYYGDCLQVCAPILASGPSDPSTPQLEGYVTVGISLGQEQAQISALNAMATGIGCVMILLSLPLAYVLIHRIFAPIRQLVLATCRIASGDLDAQVAVDRTDAIGELARAFNEMVRTVKRQREALQQANHDLERKIARRTEQLETANQRLSREIAEKEDFLRAVSHDLGAPLRNISGMAGVLLSKYREQFNEDVTHRLQRIQKNVEVETGLIAELLELSRIKTRRQRMEMVNIPNLIREIEGVLENDLNTRQIRLLIDTDLPVVHGERTRFRQIFQNLIDNAIKYMGNSTRREIHVGCELRPTEAQFYVRDTGVGIDPEDVEKIFFIFRRGKNAAHRNIAGKGVGLSSVKSIIETYSGAIWVESKVGVGSTFKFTINGQYIPSARDMEARDAACSRLREEEHCVTRLVKEPV